MPMTLLQLIDRWHKRKVLLRLIDKFEKKYILEMSVIKLINGSTKSGMEEYMMLREELDILQAKIDNYYKKLNELL